MIRRNSWLAAIVLLYWACEWVLTLVSATHGLLTPAGGIDVGVALLTLVVVALRLTAIFLVPAIAVYRLLGHMLTRTQIRR